MSANTVKSSTSMDVGPFAVRFQRFKAELHQKMVEMLDPSQLQRWSPERLRRELRALAQRLIQSSNELLSDIDRERLVQELLAEALGLGPLEPLMQDPTISDILVNGPNSVYVERNGRLELTPIVFADDNHLKQLIQRIVAQVGRRTDESSPMVDARLPDGSRVNAILPPLSLDGPVLSIRRFGVRLTTEDLLSLGTLPLEMLTLLRAAVESRISLLISGGTGSGKTTFLNALSRFIPNDERLITIEDAAELKLQQKHVLRLETRPANIDGHGAVSTRDLVRNALRMRPDRIIVGECRGPEALDMLQAMNTGHEGSLTTVHANDAHDALTRLETMVLLNSLELPVSVLRHYIASALTVIVQLTRLKGGSRKVTRIIELTGQGPDGYAFEEIFGFRQTGVVDGMAQGEFYATGYKPRFLSRLQASGIPLDDDLFAARPLAVSVDRFVDVSSAAEINFDSLPEVDLS
jgi:pilus assembly protein CpaF